MASRTSQGQPWSRFRVGLIALILIAIATYFGFTKNIPFTHGYRVHAVFESSNNVRPGSPVRIAGVNVGKVVNVERYRETDLTDVTMEIEDAGLPIHRDATMKIRPRIFLEGNFFVDLKPGSPSAPTISGGDTIGPTQTATPVQLDELFTALQSDTRADLQTVLQEFGSALTSKPTAAQDATLEPSARGLSAAQSLNKLYDSAPQSEKGSALVFSALLGTQPHDLSRLFASIARLSAALRGHESQLQQLISNFNTTAGSFAAQSTALRASIRLLGPTLQNADGAFRSLDASFPATRGFARDFLPAVRETPATVEAAFPWIAQTRALLRKDELRGLLAQLQPATADLARLTDRSLKFLPQLDLADRCFSDVIIPSGNVGVDDGPRSARRPNGSIVENFKEFWYGMVGLASEGSNFDANGNYIRVGTGGGAYSVRVGKSELDNSVVIGNANDQPRGTSPLFPRGQLPYRPDAPCHRNPLPNVNGPLAGPGAAPPSTPVPTPDPYSPPSSGSGQ